MAKWMQMELDCMFFLNFSIIMSIDATAKELNLLRITISETIDEIQKTLIYGVNFYRHVSTCH